MVHFQRQVNVQTGNVSNVITGQADDGEGENYTPVPIGDIENAVRGFIDNGKFLEATNLITGTYSNEFHLGLGQTWEKSFYDGFTHLTRVLPQAGGSLKGHTDFGERQFKDFASPQGHTGFGDLVRNIYHEYQHIENGYADPNMNWHEDEFLANYRTLANKTLPAYSIPYGRAYTRTAEGDYNVIPSVERTNIINAYYGNLVHFIKPMYGLPAVANPSQLPPL